MYAILALAVIPAYLLGSIPFGVIIAKAKGKEQQMLHVLWGEDGPIFVSCSMCLKGWPQWWSSEPL
jgi:hypothetical protein